ncbi:hypothetical protein TRIUR3_09597 [Triticum urartu]|uniref:Uncharacterized protein n=1 Tax=Triticum urartu TaxID=4572 RepID=M7ZNP8_TRIUA|nr:hypothetical protein TRIUR3_09597 [Triticum urartu]
MGRRQGGNGWGVCAALALASLVSAVVILGGGGMWSGVTGVLLSGGFADQLLLQQQQSILPTMGRPMAFQLHHL